MKALNWNLRYGLDGTIEKFFDFVAKLSDQLNQSTAISPAVALMAVTQEDWTPVTRPVPTTLLTGDP
jgi:hypothetical protein